jgi:nifR3 family TIM-barrel protein
MTLVGPLQIGALQLPINISYAPLAGCSDFAFRKIAARFKPGLVFCEMVKMDALVRSDPETFAMLRYSPEMHPIGAQLCGSNLLFAAQAAKIIEDMGFDVIDLNCGCPVDKVTKDGGGSCLLRTPHRIGDLLTTMVSAVKIPVTVKIRAGWDENTLVYEHLVKIAEQAGAKAITLHGRTRKQAYSGQAHWEWIAHAKRVATSIKVIGNGDVFKPEDAMRMLQETGCDGVLVARGTFGQPWIADDIRQLANGKSQPRSYQERKSIFFDHFLSALHSSNDRKTIVDMRRVGCWYANRFQGAKMLREALNRASSVQEIEQLIREISVEGEPS